MKISLCTSAICVAFLYVTKRRFAYLDDAYVLLTPYVDSSIVIETLISQRRVRPVVDTLDDAHNEIQVEIISICKLLLVYRLCFVSVCALFTSLVYGEYMAKIHAANKINIAP